jgi:hypothetical protein
MHFAAGWHCSAQMSEEYFCQSFVYGQFLNSMFLFHYWWFKFRNIWFYIDCIFYIFDILYLIIFFYSVWQVWPSELTHRRKWPITFVQWHSKLLRRLLLSFWSHWYYLSLCLIWKIFMNIHAFFILILMYLYLKYSRCYHMSNHFPALICWVPGSSPLVTFEKTDVIRWLVL